MLPSVTCAGSCPQAMNIAATTFAAWALKPSEPAAADPTRFFLRFTSAIVRASVLKTEDMRASSSQTPAQTLLPRPRTTFTAAGFLSVQRFPESATRCAPVASLISSAAFSLPMVTMFIPMASFVSNSILTKTEVPTTVVTAPRNFPCEVVDSAARASSSPWAATQSATSRAWATFRAAKTGARVMPSRRILTSAPPARAIAPHPRFTEATSAPSVVASGR
ncbi:MAG: hypothetical protein A4E41_00711 [Methanoregulaceae archaeon PtaU1.Bin066]|nr:MAG: hypothetical protein A4E41_00711 [Methanoregulaceae archaeon PtaU1.Bin066]